MAAPVLNILETPDTVSGGKQLRKWSRIPWKRIFSQKNNYNEKKMTNEE
jgi:hypothetical protein